MLNDSSFGLLLLTLELTKLVIQSVAFASWHGIYYFIHINLNRNPGYMSNFMVLYFVSFLDFYFYSVYIYLFLLY